MLAREILERYPEKISEFFEKFSQYFLQSDMVKVKEVLLQLPTPDPQSKRLIFEPQDVEKLTLLQEFLINVELKHFL